MERFFEILFGSLVAAALLATVIALAAGLVGIAIAIYKLILHVLPTV